MKQYYVFLPAALTLGALLFLLAAMFKFKAYYRMKRQRPPFINDFSRFPGQSLLNRLDNINEQINMFSGFLFAIPVMLYAVYISFLFLTEREMHLAGAFTTVSAGVVIMAFLMVKLFKYRNERSSLRLGYEGRVAVGQALDRLMLDDYRVYHDFPAEAFNLDHIVVGPKGVFVLKTEARPKSTSRSKRDHTTVEYDGRTLYFPDYDDSKTIAIAEEQALWLSKWISQSTSEPIAARAIVTLPGWVVKRTSAEGISVVNHQQLDVIFEHIKPRPLPGKMISLINDRLESACREASFCETGQPPHSSDN